MNDVEDQPLNRPKALAVTDLGRAFTMHSDHGRCTRILVVAVHGRDAVHGTLKPSLPSVPANDLEIIRRSRTKSVVHFGSAHRHCLDHGWRADLDPAPEVELEDEGVLA